MIRLPCCSVILGMIMICALALACACQPAVKVEGGGLAPAGAGCCLPAIPGPGFAEAPRARVGPQDAFRGAVGKDLGVPLRVEGRPRTLRGPHPDRRPARGASPNAASLPSGLLGATRTGLPPAGDDELTNTKITMALRHGVTSRFAGRTKEGG